MNIGVIVLNYLAYSETIQCVRSFLKQDFNNNVVRIVVVDNCSDNDSYSILHEEFINEKNVSVIKTESNEGYAKGNNRGYEELRRYFKPDYVIVSNDDILLEDRKIIDWIEKESKKTNFAILGPQIYSTKGRFHQNPLENFPEKKVACYREIFHCKKVLFCAYIKKLLHQKIYMSEHHWENNKYDRWSDNMTLHGAFLVFSKLYMDSYPDLYNPETFLYMEEYILKLRCDKKNLKMVFSPDYRVSHGQAVSSTYMKKSSYEKVRSRNLATIHSIRVYMKELANK